MGGEGGTYCSPDQARKKKDNFFLFQIKKGENISFLYASCLPKLLVVNTEQPPGSSKKQHKLSK